MRLYRFRVTPESPWRTPWQSDTLSGLLCWGCARSQGDAVLQRDIIEPALSGEPPFVLSDAFPGDWLPMPALVRLADWPAEERKTVKRAKWLTVNAFLRVQQGEQLSLDDLIATSGVHQYTQLRNTIGRANNTTAANGGLFPTSESVLALDGDDRPLSYLTVYARIVEEFIEPFTGLLEELSQSGFGADRSAGKGQFSMASELELAEEIDALDNPSGCVVLSTFQPGSSDPTDGAWDAFTKYGKLGPDFGLENVFKRPLVMFRPGACFAARSSRGWLGRAISMQELVAPDVVSHLSCRGVTVVHWAFGLALPLKWPIDGTGQ